MKELAPFDYEFVDTVRKYNGGRRTLPDNAVSVSSTKSFRALRFPKNASKAILCAGCKSMRLAYSGLTGAYAFVFLPDNSGHAVRVDKMKRIKSPRVIIASTEIVKILSRRYGKKEGDTFRLKMSENESKRGDVVFFTIEGLYEV